MLINACKNIVEYFKQSNLQSNLSKTLKQENMMLWNSLLHCLLSIHEMFKEISTLLIAKTNSKSSTTSTRPY